jgi:hypothetical protein
MAVVTDLHWYQVNGELRTGYYLDRWLKQNLDGIPDFLARAFDVVAIVSGTGKVRLGKSTIALQMAYYVAWILAGGRTILDEQGRIVKTIPPNRKIPFGIDHIVFSPDELKEKAEKLPKHSVIVYDEGRVGLQSDRHMEYVNKQVADFFQECGQYGHVIIIVLPDFFKLGVDYATNRSLFLVNVFADKEFNRGYFNFYNENNKEKLYLYGKKKIGTMSKYNAYPRNFWGRFSSFIPVDRQAYEQLKKNALSRKKYRMPEIQAMKQRDMLIWLYSRKKSFPINKFQEVMREAGVPLSDHIFARSIANAERLIHEKDYTIDGWPMPEWEIDVEMIRIKEGTYYGGWEVRELLGKMVEKHKNDEELNRPLTELEEELYESIEKRNEELNIEKKKPDKFLTIANELLSATKVKAINISPPIPGFEREEDTKGRQMLEQIQREVEEEKIREGKLDPKDSKFFSGAVREADILEEYEKDNVTAYEEGPLGDESV